jgi:hypothetical protein
MAEGCRIFRVSWAKPQKAKGEVRKLEKARQGKVEVDVHAKKRRGEIKGAVDTQVQVHVT